MTAQSCRFSSKQTWFCCCSGGKFLFSFQVPSIYPHEPPKVKCKTKVQLFFLLFHLYIFWHAPEKMILISFLCEMQVYHPNIDLEGNVCLNVLREDWKPVLNINTIIYGLYLLFEVQYGSLQHLSLSHIYIYTQRVYSHFIHLCRNQTMRIPLISRLLLCWEIIPSCLNQMWRRLCLVELWPM